MEGRDFSDENVNLDGSDGYQSYCHDLMEHEYFFFPKEPLGECRFMV